MVKSTGPKKINVAVFISGTGSNFKNLVIHSFKRNSKFRIELVISNNPKAKGLDYANKFKVKKRIIHYSLSANYKDWVRSINELNPSLIKFDYGNKIFSRLLNDRSYF